MNVNYNYSPSPDEPGWYFFKKKPNQEEVCVVRLRDDGRAFVLSEEGDSWELDDPVGVWTPIDENL